MIYKLFGSQSIKKLDNFIEKRTIIAKKYDEIFRDDKDVKLPYQSNKSKSSFHLYIIRIKKNGKLNRNVIFEN